MRIYTNFSTSGGFWNFAPFNVYGGKGIFGFVICNIGFEWTSREFWKSN